MFQRKRRIVMKQGIIPKAWGKMQKHFRKRTGVAWGRRR